MIERIREEASLRGESLAQAVRHHLLTGVIARVARSEHRASFVLRGGMLTRAWVAPAKRPTTDLDYVGDFAFSVDETARRLRAALEVDRDDGLVIDRERVSARGIWLESAFPGVRLEVAIGLGRADQSVGLDVGFGDPLVPAATWVELGGASVRACRPETQVAWKLHCLAEMGAGFRPKDVADLWLVTARVALDRAAMPPAIEAAFASRGYSLAQAAGVLDEAHWATKTARVRWEPYRARFPELPRVVGDLRERLGPILRGLA